MVKKFLVAAAILCFSGLEAHAINIHVNTGDFNITTERSYSSQYSDRYINERAADSLSNIAEAVSHLDGDALDAAVGQPIYERLVNQLGRWYANVKYSKGTVQNSRSWIIEDPAIRNAWSQGYDGSGIDIIIQDYHYSTPYRYGYTYQPSHGEIVSTIAGGTNRIGATEFVGVAPEANIIKAPASNIPDDRHWQADIVNRSFGGRSISSPDKYTYNLWRDFSNLKSRLNTAGYDPLIVQAAGNSGHTCISTCVEVVISLTGSRLGDQTLVVGAVDSNNNIASYSNRAGNLRDHYVVDHGDFDISYRYGRWGQHSGTGRGSGTSFAAPRVAGKAAIIKSKFRDLNGTQLADLIKRTADDLGAPGVDPIYGHGKINLGRALSPVGEIR